MSLYLREGGNSGIGCTADQSLPGDGGRVYTLELFICDQSLGSRLAIEESGLECLDKLSSGLFTVLALL